MIGDPRTAEWAVLVVPCVERGRGSGHLKRSIGLVSALRAMGRRAFLYLRSDAGPGGRSAADILAAFSGELDPSAVFSADPASRKWTFVLLDRFRTPRTEYRFWSSLAPVVGVDEGGADRRSFDYLLDLLPSPPGAVPPNERRPDLLPSPKNRRPSFIRSGDGPLRILVVFGGEDAASLSIASASSLSRSPDASVDIILGALNGERRDAVPPGPNCRLIGPVPDLKERLAEYDLVVSLFGLTAYEAARARVPVLLVSPTRLHERLARRTGFVSAGMGKSAAARLARYLPRLAEIAAATERAVPASDGGSYAERVASISFPAGVGCPLCASGPAVPGRASARFPDRTYRRCPSCGLLHLVRTSPPPITYARDYFFADYKKQYGKTYLEDFPSLERSGALRAGRVKSLLPSGSASPRLLDIGCAYGPFLAAARNLGFGCFGVDPAADAVRFVSEELGIPAGEGFFPDFDALAAFGGVPFDAVTLWYVIEHFPRLGPVLESVSRALNPGGVFAFSTPSGGGVSARVRFGDFLEKSPSDHFSIWEPSRTAALLRRFGFRLEKIVVTGHHPERFPGLSGASAGDPGFRLASGVSRAFGLGDTFEVYAIKERSLP